MKTFITEHFLLNTVTAQRLYHEFAAKMPIIDYHCHLPPEQIASDKNFDNLSEIWLNGDHYKWRAMRTRGIHEQYITGQSSPWEKMQRWAATVPYTLRNPLYHWAHLELLRYFDIDELLNPSNAAAIYAACNEKLAQPEYSVRNLLRKMNVRWICTTDDPADGLEHHWKLKSDNFEIPVLPAFRPDAAMQVDDPAKFIAYAERLEKAAGLSTRTYHEYLAALQSRHDFFAARGCTVSDHGLEQMVAEDYTEAAIKNIFNKIRGGRMLDEKEQKQFRSVMLVNFAEWDHAKNWVQQYHLGALRNSNSRMLQSLGPDTGWDSIGDFSQARPLAKFLDRLDRDNILTKTILYNLNPADNEMMASMAGNFNDGSVASKVQWGAAWWFLDQKDGITKQINALSNLALLSGSVGMLTDSRSFLSYPRHEYFRRVLCNIFGDEIEKGELPNDMEWIGKVICDICFYNAKSYFSLSVSDDL